MSNRICKKCGTSLPEGYKYKKCEDCINTKVDLIRKIWKKGKKIAIPVTSVGLSVVIGVITKGRK